MTDILELNKKFQKLKEKENKKEINFLSLDNFEGVYIGKKFGSFPVIFFNSHLFNFHSMPNEKFSNIKISQGVNYNLSILDKQVSGPFFSFELISNNSKLVESFFTLILDLINFYNLNPNNFKIRGYIENIESLFADGLFGELLLIHSSSNINRMIDFWHLPLNARFDFCSENEKIEVKTTTSNIREHHISLEQIQTNGSEECFLF